MPKPGHVILLCALTLLTLGVVMVNSADMAISPVRGDAPAVVGVTPASILLSRSTAYAALAIVAMLVASALPIRTIAARLLPTPAPAGARQTPGERSDAPTPSGPDPLRAGAGLGFLLLAGLGFAALLLLVYAPVIGREVNGSHRWIGLPIPGLADALSVQPSELAKWGVLGVLAIYAAKQGRGLERFWTGLLPALGFVGLLGALIVIEDLGTGVLVVSAACLVLVAGGARVWQFAMFLPLGAAALALAVITSPYRVNRIMAFLDPYERPETTGYHMIQSMLAVQGGEGFGRGLGHGLQKFGYLPEDRTDFLFAVLCEELGVPGAAVVVAVFIAIVASCWHVYRREPSRALKLYVLGVSATVGLQAIINIAVVTGLGPTKGIALPLVSSGGTGWILTSFSLGLVAAIARSQPLSPATPRLPAASSL